MYAPPFGYQDRAGLVASVTPIHAGLHHQTPENDSPHVCSICGAVGHIARACTAPYCCLCDLFGHHSSRCEEACKECGHLHSNVHRGRGDPGSACPVPRCTTCGLRGHLPTQCPDTQQESKHALPPLASPAAAGAAVPSSPPSPLTPSSESIPRSRSGTPAAGMAATPAAGAYQGVPSPQSAQHGSGGQRQPQQQRQMEVTPSATLAEVAAARCVEIKSMWKQQQSPVDITPSRQAPGDDGWGHNSSEKHSSDGKLHGWRGVSEPAHSSTSPAAAGAVAPSVSAACHSVVAAGSKADHREAAGDPQVARIKSSWGSPQPLQLQSGAAGHSAGTPGSDPHQAAPAASSTWAARASVSPPLPLCIPEPSPPQHSASAAAARTPVSHTTSHGGAVIDSFCDSAGAASGTTFATVLPPLDSRPLPAVHAMATAAPVAAAATASFTLADDTPAGFEPTPPGFAARTAHVKSALSKAAARATQLQLQQQQQPHPESYGAATDAGGLDDVPPGFGGSRALATQGSRASAPAATTTVTATVAAVMPSAGRLVEPAVVETTGATYAASSGCYLHDTVAGCAERSLGTGTEAADSAAETPAASWLPPSQQQQEQARDAQQQHGILHNITDAAQQQLQPGSPLSSYATQGYHSSAGARWQDGNNWPVSPPQGADQHEPPSQPAGSRGERGGSGAGVSMLRSSLLELRKSIQQSSPQKQQTRQLSSAASPHQQAQQQQQQQEEQHVHVHMQPHPRQQQQTVSIPPSQQQAVVKAGTAMHLESSPQDPCGAASRWGDSPPVAADDGWGTTAASPAHAAGSAAVHATARASAAAAAATPWIRAQQATPSVVTTVKAGGTTELATDSADTAARSLPGRGRGGIMPAAGTAGQLNGGMSGGRGAWDAAESEGSTSSGAPVAATFAGRASSAAPGASTSVAPGSSTWESGLQQLLPARDSRIKWRVILPSDDRAGPFTSAELQQWLVSGGRPPKGVTPSDAKAVSADPSSLRLCGIAATDYHAQRLPGTKFYKSLPGLVAAVSAGMTYSPVTKADLVKGVPPKGWNEQAGASASAPAAVPAAAGKSSLSRTAAFQARASTPQSTTTMQTAPAGLAIPSSSWPGYPQKASEGPSPGAAAESRDATPQGRYGPLPLSASKGEGQSSAAGPPGTTPGQRSSYTGAESMAAPAPGSSSWESSLQQLLPACDSRIKWRVILPSDDRAGPFTPAELQQWLVSGGRPPKGVTLSDAKAVSADPSSLRLCGIAATDYNAQRLPGTKFYKSLPDLLAAVSAGMTYSSVTKADLAKGVPPKGWNEMR